MKKGVAENGSDDDWGRAVSEYKSTVMKVAIHKPDSNPCYGEGVVYLELVDEGAGSFFELSQDVGTVRIELEELEVALIEARKMAAWIPEEAPDHPRCGDDPQ